MAAGLNKRRMIQTAVFKELAKVSKPRYNDTRSWLRYSKPHYNDKTLIMIFAVDVSF